MDLHFHGAFGIDLMSATPRDLTRLCDRLGREGVAAFCPTTLSAPPRELRAAVEKIGRWMRTTCFDGLALPLGIHLEGPFVSAQACGAHPPRAIRHLRLPELEELWESSHHTLKLITLAPETLSDSDLRRVVSFARKRSIVLSLGHSRATEAEAARAFAAGLTGVTHAWNALPFHQRAPGALGAAIGRKGIHLELIPDGIHVSPTVVRWTLALHRPGPVCFVSDCIPSGGTRGLGTYSFGPLRVRRVDGASRTPDGRLAGGGDPLSASFRRWVERESRASGRPLVVELRAALPQVTSDPLRALGISLKSVGNRKIRWNVSRSGIRIDSVFSNR